MLTADGITLIVTFMNMRHRSNKDDGDDIHPFNAGNDCSLQQHLRQGGGLENFYLFTSVFWTAL